MAIETDDIDLPRNWVAVGPGGRGVVHAVIIPVSSLRLRLTIRSFG